MQTDTMNMPKRERTLFLSRSHQWKRLPRDADSKAASRWPKSALDFIRGRTQKKIAFRIIIACLCICVFLRAIDAVILPVILPSISTELHATSLQAYWSGSSYLFAMTIVTPIFGGLAEARTCMFLALGCFISGSMLCALAQSIVWLIGARVVSNYLTAVEIPLTITTAPRGRCRRHRCHG